MVADTYSRRCESVIAPEYREYPVKSFPCDQRCGASALVAANSYADHVSFLETGIVSYGSCHSFSILAQRRGFMYPTLMFGGV
jgi:hypothetical protein